MNPICSPKYRGPLAETLRDPAARKLFILLKNMGAKNMRHDHKLVKQRDFTYRQMPDLNVWYADCRGGLFVAMIRHEDGGWTLNS